MVIHHRFNPYWNFFLIKNEQTKIPFHLKKYENKNSKVVLQEAKSYLGEGRLQYATHHIAGYAFYLIGNGDKRAANQIITDFINLDLQTFQEMAVFAEAMMKKKYGNINDPIHNKNFKTLIDMIMINLDNKINGASTY